MPNHNDLKAILEARFDADNADLQDCPELQRRFEQLVDTALQGVVCTRNAFLEAIQARYQTYRRERLRSENRRQP